MGGERDRALVALRERLADTLAGARLTKSQLAARAGLGRTTVHEALRPEAGAPSAETVAALAAALGLPEEERRELLALRRTAATDPDPAPAPEPLPGPGRPIRAWDPHTLEVHPAGAAAVPADAGAPRALPGYVRRTHDGILAQAVRAAADGASRMVLLVGSSSTGKTRACWEAVQPLADQGWRLWHPFDPTRAEAALADLQRVGPRTVVWLNEAQHYLGDPRAGERIAAALHTVLSEPERAPVLVLGTLWPEYADRYAALPSPSGPDPHSRLRELLAGRTLTVPEVFTPEALAAAEALAGAGDGLLADALTRAAGHGRLAQDLAGAPELLRRYEHGSPPGRALLEAAMDARRLGAGLHLPQDFLVDAAADYLADHDWDELADDWAEAAFADLARRVHGKQAPLRRGATRSPRPPLGRPAPGTAGGPPEGAAQRPVFRLADYLEQHGRATRWRFCPPASFWYAAHAHLTRTDDLDRLADAAEHKYHLEWAQALRHRAAGTRPGAGVAPSVLSRLRAQVASWKGAEVFYRQAADAGYAAALAELARLRELHGDLNGAEALALKAADAAYAAALTELARLREQDGDPQGTEVLYRQAAVTGYAAALAELARPRGQDGGPTRAQAALARQAVDVGYHEALTTLARVRELYGDRKGAEFLYREVADAGYGVALAELARLLREQDGDPRAIGRTG
ncbi:helix-turn-helix domain-containing protein [Kitasatospora sp. NPDC049258]|uniref:helix-turn-helix domain-containing protein n=1 Tax=Kitasatospora sp. NPDC049258 TaxID=3155394 RepID=UPI003444BC1E